MSCPIVYGKKNGMKKGCMCDADIHPFIFGVIYNVLYKTIILEK